MIWPWSSTWTMSKMSDELKTDLEADKETWDTKRAMKDTVRCLWRTVVYVPLGVLIILIAGNYWLWFLYIGFAWFGLRTLCSIGFTFSVVLGGIVNLFCGTDKLAYALWAAVRTLYTTMRVSATLFMWSIVKEI